MVKHAIRKNQIFPPITYEAISPIFVINHEIASIEVIVLLFHYRTLFQNFSLNHTYDPHPNPLPKGEGVAIPSPLGGEG